MSGDQKIVTDLRTEMSREKETCVRNLRTEEIQGEEKYGTVWNTIQQMGPTTHKLGRVTIPINEHMMILEGHGRKDMLQLYPKPRYGDQHIERR